MLKTKSCHHVCSVFCDSKCNLAQHNYFLFCRPTLYLSSFYQTLTETTGAILILFM